MEKYDVYKDISLRTGGDIFIGVVGPVRTGKSTFITKFMETAVLPNISNKLQKQITTDEMPQSADGKIIMTTQPKFIPANGVKVHFKNKSTANVRLVDCVGYFVDGAVGHEENGQQRYVKTPWSDKEIPFETAAEIGTKKVINEYSTIGIVVTTDGSIGDIERENYVLAENRVINELKKLNKPFVIVLNCREPESKSAIKLANELEQKHGVPVLCVNVLNMSQDDLNGVIEKVLFEFPMKEFNVNIPKWMQALSADNPIICDMLNDVKECSKNISKMRDVTCLTELFNDSEKYNPVEIEEVMLGKGVAQLKICAKEGLFFDVLTAECGEKISDDYELMSYIKDFSEQKKKFVKIKDALSEAEEKGYGVVLPTIEEMNLEEPMLVKQGGRYGVKLKASAPSLHIMKVDVSTEVAPTVGTEKQGEDLVNYIMQKFQDNPQAIWDTNMFGKSLHDLVNEGLTSKLTAMPKEAQGKMRKTLSRIVNENKGGIICILL